MNGVKVNASASVTYVDKGWNRICKDMKVANTIHAEIGFPSPSPQHIEHNRFTGETSKDKLNLASLATVLEKGSVVNHIPPRPFMQQTFDSNSSQARSLLAKGMDLIHRGTSPKTVLTGIGLWYKGKMQEKMIDGTFAPNAPLTVALKGSSKPLIDWGNLHKSVKSVVRNGKV